MKTVQTLQIQTRSGANTKSVLIVIVLSNIFGKMFTQSVVFTHYKWPYLLGIQFHLLLKYMIAFKPTILHL